MDSDLADAVESLKQILAKRKLEANFGKAAPELVDSLKKELRIPPRYRAFLAGANPIAVESVTPVEKIRLFSAEELVRSQTIVREPEGGTPPLDWKASWVAIGESSLLSDPYFLDVAKLDAEGDCPVYTAMSGQERWAPVLAASTFAQFLRIVVTTMEDAQCFGEAVMDDEDEDSFRKALAPRIKVIDSAAMRAGHWT